MTQTHTPKLNSTNMTHSGDKKTKGAALVF